MEEKQPQTQYQEEEKQQQQQAKTKEQKRKLNGQSFQWFGLRFCAHYILCRVDWMEV